MTLAFLQLIIISFFVSFPHCSSPHSRCAHYCAFPIIVIITFWVCPTQFQYTPLYSLLMATIFSLIIFYVHHIFSIFPRKLKAVNLRLFRLRHVSNFTYVNIHCSICNSTSRNTTVVSSTDKSCG